MIQDHNQLTTLGNAAARLHMTQHDMHKAIENGDYDLVWDLSPAHFSERHGLFVIIALGESLIVAGTAIAEEQRQAELVLVAGAALVVACLLWWSYFGWLKEAMEHGFRQAPPSHIGAIARDAFSFVHFPLICGIIGFAVAVEEIVAHPESPAKGAVVASLAVAVGLFVGASAVAYRRIAGKVLLLRLVILATTIGGTALVAGADPVWPLAVVALGLLAIVVAEGITAPHHDAPAHPTEVSAQLP